jgi:hypothetical protein
MIIRKRQEGKTMTNYNKAEIMRAANGYAKTMSRTDALRKAWSQAKTARIASQPTQRDRYNAAFKTKYPEGTFEPVIGSKNYRFKVTFAPGGKTYTYIGGIVMIGEKLGLEVA